ncbi:MAG: hypothetical protein ACRCUU_09905, partial [Plesiomonas sp.]
MMLLGGNQLNLHRYIIAGGASIALHALLLITTDQAQAFYTLTPCVLRPQSLRWGTGRIWGV